MSNGMQNHQHFNSLVDFTTLVAKKYREKNISSQNFVREVLGSIYHDGSACGNYIKKNYKKRSLDGNRHAYNISALSFKAETRIAAERTTGKEQVEYKPKKSVKTLKLSSTKLPTLMSPSNTPNIKYKGVVDKACTPSGISSLSTNRWLAVIYLHVRKIVLGDFPTQHAAAEAHDRAIIRAKGPRNCSKHELNFPIESYSVDTLASFTQFDKILKRCLFGCSFRPQSVDFAYLATSVVVNNNRKVELPNQTQKKDNVNSKEVSRNGNGQLLVKKEHRTSKFESDSKSSSPNRNIPSGFEILQSDTIDNKQEGKNKLTSPNGVKLNETSFVDEVNKATSNEVFSSPLAKTFCSSKKRKRNESLLGSIVTVNYGDGSNYTAKNEGLREHGKLITIYSSDL